jgi:superfamily II DNA/RNA helicase
VLGLAQTGSGKTAAFTLPMLTLLEKGRARARMPRTLILEPTRELAAQVHEAFQLLGKNHKLNIALLMGGVSFDEQNKIIDRGADVLIATPGRLLDHMERGKLMLTHIEIFVVDEADRMLDMGFIPDIERIAKSLPLTKQTLFFSATMPPEIQRITNQFLHAPVEVKAQALSSTAETITQYAVYSPSDEKEKRDGLRALLRAHEADVKNGIIFANRKTTVAVLEKSLQKHGFSVARCMATWTSSRAAHAGCVPQQQDHLPDRLRCGRAWSRHSGSEPRLQFRRADPFGRLCAPHRPYGPCRARIARSGSHARNAKAVQRPNGPLNRPMPTMTAIAAVTAAADGTMMTASPLRSASATRSRPS